MTFWGQGVPSSRSHSRVMASKEGFRAQVQTCLMGIALAALWGMPWGQAGDSEDKEYSSVGGTRKMSSRGLLEVDPGNLAGDRCTGEVRKGVGDGAARRKEQMGAGRLEPRAGMGGLTWGQRGFGGSRHAHGDCARSRGVFAPGSRGTGPGWRAGPGGRQHAGGDWKRCVAQQSEGAGDGMGQTWRVVLHTPTRIYCCGGSETSVRNPLCFLLGSEHDATWKLTFPYIYVLCSTLLHSNKYYGRRLINKLHNACFPILCDHQPKHRQMASRGLSRGICNGVFSIYDANCT